MFVFLNGRLVPEQEGVISVFDRGFLYGDGLFETIAVRNGIPFRWEQHLARLRGGAEFLKLRLPYSSAGLRRYADDLVAANQLPDALLRLTLSRGVGVRGYSPAGADHPTVVMSLHPVEPDSRDPLSWRLVTASFRLPTGERLAQFKTCNKLPQILARAEAEAAGGTEALLMNTDGCVVEAASSNLFWIDGGAVCTPPVASGVLAGVTRAVVEELCQTLHLPVRDASLAKDELLEKDGVFLSLSSLGIVEGISLDNHTLRRSPITGQVREAYSALFIAETQPQAQATLNPARGGDAAIQGH
jgi:aminodeoxychorismate lyase